MKRSDKNTDRGEKAFFGGKNLVWSIKITAVTLVLSGAASLLSQTAVAASDILIAVMLLIFMILTSIIFDGIGVSVASCSRDEVERYCLLENADCECAETVLALIDGAEKVNNVCADVIGDVCGVLSGACGSGIASAIAAAIGISPVFPSIAVSGMIAAITVGGKAAFKTVAIRNSAEMVFFAGKALTWLKGSRRGKRE